MSGSGIVGLLFIAIVLFAGPKEQFKYRLAVLVVFMTVIVLIFWSRAPAQFEADIRELF
jgi:hypothetical protein